MSKCKLAIVRGGPSNEHAVSLDSAKSILEYIDGKKYALTDVYISKNNRWVIDDGPEQTDVEALAELKHKEIEVVFLAVHGTYGEDGTLQEKLEAAGLKFTGSDAKSSKQTFDKSIAEAVFKKHGLPVPASQVLTNAGQKIAIDIPFVVKPVADGSSVGVTIVKKPEDVKKALHTAFQSGERVLVQQYIAGRELSCGVLEQQGKPTALPPTELIPKQAEFYDYDAKYVVGATDEITPPDLPAETIRKIQDLALDAHRVLGCRNYSRTDMFLTPDGELQLIETNTLPGFTHTSIVPQQAAAAGITFKELIDIIIENARTAV